ncbi:CSC1-like protein 1 isoform X2 [Scleropages formosus]|uniref:CSC1-like protein 1 isoform X2 n=1 Tax=Scleropages formosus TaxID=113540 RepID=UPI0010FA7A5D|nr:CSC1-like protein 1 isoform X2 [Scleropages formosus]
MRKTSRPVAVSVGHSVQWSLLVKEEEEEEEEKEEKKTKRSKSSCSHFFSVLTGVPMDSLWFQLVENGTGPQNSNSCFSTTEGNTVLQGLAFGGVPVVLLLNFVFFLALLVVFSGIRKKLWDYGRLALVAENRDGGRVSGRSGSKHHYSRMSSSASTTEEHDKGFFSWLPFVIGMDMDMIRDRCGIDATHYLSFQRHLIFLLFIICVMSMAVILPVNLSGNLLGNDPYSFGRTTIGNLKEGDKLLWLHTVFAVLYLIFTILVLRHHTSQMKDVHSDIARTTLFVCGIPKEASKERIETHFSEAYPTCNVLEVHLCYDVAKLIQHFQERKRVERNLQYYKKILECEGKRETINPRLCGYICCCAVSGCEEVDAIDYYSSQKSCLQEDEERLRQLVPQHPLGMAFVTLTSESMASFILKDFNALDCNGGVVSGDEVSKPVRCGCSREPQPSADSAALRVNKWEVSYAPHPNNIYWENLSLQTAIWWIRCLGFNFVLFILLFFLTTPSIIITTMDKFNVTKPIYYLNSAVISQFLPTLLLWSFSALLPTIVYYSTLAESHWTRSSENISMMHKLYIFLLFMVLILPSLGLTSLDVFFRWLFDTKFLSQGKLRFECVFLPDQGAFFVNYVIAAALVGSGLELLRLPGLLLYTVRMALARSAAERKYIKQNQAYEFEYGAMYGWTLCVFTVIMAYSITCPVIVPFGILYMMLKHLVDKHNLFFAYLPACLDRQVHMGAVTQAWTAPILCLLWLYFFSVIRTGFKAETSLFTFVVLCVTVGVSIAYSCFGHFKYLSPHSYNDSAEISDGVSVGSVGSVYLPKVLQASCPTESHQEFKHESYGALGSTPAAIISEQGKDSQI